MQTKHGGSKGAKQGASKQSGSKQSASKQSGSQQSGSKQGGREQGSSQSGSQSGSAQGDWTKKTKSGVQSGLTGIDQRSQQSAPVGVPGASGQPRIDDAGEPLRTAGGLKPGQASALGKDNPDKPPGSPEKNSV